MTDKPPEPIDPGARKPARPHGAKPAEPAKPVEPVEPEESVAGEEDPGAAAEVLRPAPTRPAPDQ